MRRTLIASPSTVQRVGTRWPAARASSHRRAAARRRRGGAARSAASNGATRRSSWPACRRASSVTSSSRWRRALTLLLSRATNSSRRSAGRSRRRRPCATLETTPRLPRRSCAACCHRSARRFSSSRTSRERALEIVHRARRLDALELEVALRALAHRLADLLGELHARLGEHLGRQLRVGGGEALELGDEAAVQAAPLARDVVQVVALLPALQAVRLGIARLGGVGDRLAREPRPGCRRTTRAIAAGGPRAGRAAARCSRSAADRRRSPRARRRSGPAWRRESAPPAPVVPANASFRHRFSTSLIRRL